MSEYTLIDGIKCYSPELAFSNDGFDEKAFTNLEKVEEGNFWFKARNQLIEFLVRKFRPKGERTNFLEIGCGTGYVLMGLSGIPELTLTGSEIFLEGLTFARKRLPKVELIQLDATRIPFRNSHDMVGAFDVLEHIDGDTEVMNCVHETLRQDGIFIITVPQYQWMWSSMDDHAFHKRRYSRTELKEKLTRAGFKVLYLGSFVFSLFPFMVLSRYAKKKNTKDVMSELRISGLMNSVFYFLMRVDLLLIKIGFALPFGGSIVCVAKKVSSSEMNPANLR